MAELIKTTDSLNDGRKKLNDAITDSNAALSTANTAKQTANLAKAESESTQTQLDTIVIEGDSSVEAAQARVNNSGTAFPTLKQRLDAEHQEVTAQLQQNMKKTNDFIVLSDYCSNKTGGVDVTSGFLEAIAYAKTNKKSILVDGIFLISQPVTIRSDIPKIFGTTRTRSRLLFTGIPDDYCITTGSYYTQQNLFENISIECTDGTCKYGVKVESDEQVWGYSAEFDNVTIKGFKENILKYFDAYSVTLTNCILDGYTTGVFPTQTLYSTLFISESNSSSNLHHFKNTLFLNGRIGIQTIGGGSAKFDNCTFENLSLFLNMEAREFGTETDKSHYLSFVDGWFERIPSGIVNAKLSDGSLNPFSPALNIVPVHKYIKMWGNKAVWDVVTYPLSIEVNGPDRINFTWENGYDLPITKKSWTPLQLGGNWTGLVEFKQLDTGQVVLRGSIKPLLATGAGEICSGLPIPRFVHATPVTDVAGPIVKTDLSLMASINGKLLPQFGATYDVAKTYNFDTTYTKI